MMKMWLHGTALLVWLTGNAALASCTGTLDYATRTLAGEPRNLCDYRGKVVLVVNTASYCGFTRQYEGLEALYQKYQGRGLVVLGFPSNDFGAQEPGSNADVKDFCERTFKVRFPMFEKSRVIGADANPLYQRLTTAAGQAPKWNFHKYLVGRDGQVAGSFASKVEPDAPELVRVLERLLASPG